MSGARPRRAAAAGIALVAPLVGALLLGPMAAAVDGPEEATIAYSEPTETGLEILVSVPAGADVEIDGVTVTIDGQTTEATAQSAGSSSPVGRTAVLAIDTSNTMRGAAFAAAKSAATQFLRTVPADVRVGIVTFSGDVQARLQPTTDRTRAIRVIDGLTLSPGTQLYDGLLSALGVAGVEGQRNVLVLTDGAELADGADTGDIPLESVTSRLESAGARVDVVALGDPAGALDALTQLAEAGGGEVLAGRQQDLAALFSAQAAVLADQISVTAQVPAGLEASEATVIVTLPSASGDLVAESYIAVGAATDSSDATPLPTAAPSSGGAVPEWMLYTGVGLVGLGVFVILLMLVPARERPMTAAERVATYAGSERPGAGAHAARSDDQALTQVKEAAAEVLRHNQDLEARISRRLEGAGSSLKAAEWLLVHVAIFLVVSLVGLLLGGGNLVVGVMFLVLGAVGPWVFLGMKRNRRRKAFANLLPDVLQLMSGSLSAGLSLAQAVDTVVREGPDPIASEFRRVLIETRIGVSLEDAFDGVAERFQSKDFSWVVMAIRIQRQVGGNLAELFDTVAGTMREREYMRRQVSALAAEGKLSAIVLSALPPLFLLYLVVANRDYVAPLFTDIRGIAMLVGSGLWLGIGIFWMSRLVKVDV